VDVIDGDARQRVVVGDRALPLGVGDVGVDDVSEVDEEGLVVLVERVAFDGDADRFAGLAGGEGERAAGDGGVIAGRDGGVVGGGGAEGDGLGVDLREGDGEVGGGGAGVALGDGDVVEGHVGRCVVVEDGADAGA